MAVARLGNFDSFTPKHLATYRLFCLHGENGALIRERVAALGTAFAAEGSAPALIDLDGDALAREPFALADELGALSLFAERRFLRVTLGARVPREAFANALPRLPGAEGVRVAVDAGADKRQDEVIRLLSADPLCLTIACPADRADGLADFAGRILAEHGIAVEPALARELVELADGDRTLLANELMKLSFLCDAGSVLDGATVRAVAADEKTTLVKEAADRVLSGDVGAVLDAADRLQATAKGVAQLANIALVKLFYAHANATGSEAAAIRRAIARLSDAVRASRSSDRLSEARAERDLIETARSIGRTRARM